MVKYGLKVKTYSNNTLEKKNLQRVSLRINGLRQGIWVILIKKIIYI